eukprot:CAMPEP_0170060582 /NCGR_PEP_ID=MMETSP0019_2-20121128/2472_1 /TAXON_ID=98059 /ORGANISM="Dinobryon sp., Strain UTEXLB2267" /LENGTH=161 /DNA_ID=CAMNT_0010266201 /DNA_START=425 /DNA_END=910 /DNA_ORIENTATION=+
MKFAALKIHFKMFVQENSTVIRGMVRFVWSYASLSDIVNLSSAKVININATQTVKDDAREHSQDIDEHLGRFLTRSYNVDRFALLNFAMNAKEAIVLPRDDAHHDKVYTYQHSTNSLYRGKTLIRAPAVAKLPCPAPIPIAKLEEDRVVPERLTGRKRGLG